MCTKSVCISGHEERKNHERMRRPCGAFTKLQAFTAVNLSLAQSSHCFNHHFLFSLSRNTVRFTWYLRLLCLDPFALTSKQKSELQIAATTAVLPSESTCPGMNEEPTDTEKDFATNPYWKYFTYDTFDSHSWVTLNNLEECMRRVKGGLESLFVNDRSCVAPPHPFRFIRIDAGGSNDWVGADDLWEAHKLSLSCTTSGVVERFLDDLNF